MEVEEQAKNQREESPPARGTQSRLIVTLCVLIACFIIAVTVGLVLNEDNNDDNGNERMTERRGVLVDCMPGLRRDEEKMRRSKEECLERKCLWKPQMEAGAPWCVFPAIHDYVIDANMTSDVTGRRMTGRLRRGGNDVRTLGVADVFDHVTVEVEFQTDNRVRIKLYPTNVTRWEIPDSILNIEATNDVMANASTSLVNVTFSENPFGVIVTRKDTGNVVFNSSHPGTLLADQFLQLTTSLPSGHLYGFGEHRHLSLRHNMSWKSWAMFTRDTGPNSDWNLYGQHPVYLNVEHDGKANIVLLKNSNAMEVLLQPEPYPAVTFTSIGGVLDFYIYVGDSPADVTSHYIKSIGAPVFPPYWSLGYHLCRWGYQNISDMRSVVERTIQAGIPYDGQWADIDTFYKNYPLTFDPDQWEDFPAFVDEMHNKHHLHFVTMVDPGVGADETIVREIRSISSPGFSSYDMLDSGKQQGVFVMNADGTDVELAEVWPGITVFPDFTNPDSESWWTEQVRHYVDDIGVKVDALWIDMNEPASFVPPSQMNCRNNTWNYPSWCPNILDAGHDCKMFVKTICMDTRQNMSLHYDVHSLYGHTMAIRTYRALDNLPSPYYKDKRPWTMTRSSFVGTGHYASKWMGDNRATWEDMKNSIISILEFGFFGFAMNGADICGFWLEPSFELCVRWHQLGAFYPLARNHNGKGDAPNLFKHQDPASFGQDFVDLIKPALITRYRLLPYLYTSMYHAHNDGRMVMQPLFYQFPLDQNTLSIDTQFMLGPALLVSPILQQGATRVNAYFPEGRWFDYFTGEEIRSPGGKTVELATPIDKFNLHLRGGHVIPWQEPDVTTFASRKNGLGLIVALDETGKAHGEMFWDDGETKVKTNSYNIITFSMQEAGILTISPKSPKSPVGANLKFQTIEIYGLPRMPSNVKVNNVDWTLDKYQYISDGIIQITKLNLPMTSISTITWSLY